MFGGFNDPTGYSVSVGDNIDAVIVDNGKLIIEGNAAVRLDGRVYSSGNMLLTANKDGDVSGGNLEHTAGTIQSLSGDVDISAKNDWINLNGDNDLVTGRYVAAGRDILLNDDTSVNYSRTLYADEDVVLAAGEQLHGYTNLTVEAGQDIMFGVDDQSTPWLGSSGYVAADDNLILDAGESIYAHGDLVSHYGNIEIYSSNTTTYLYGDLIRAFGNVLLNNNTEFGSVDDQSVEAQTGKLTANGWLHKGESSLYLKAAGNVSLAKYVTADSGGVSIVSETGTIFTPGAGGGNDTLNVPISGYSDQGTGAGVRLHPDMDNRAAIVIKSKEDLKLGESAVLTASGMYYTSEEFELTGIDTWMAFDNYIASLEAKYGSLLEDAVQGFDEYLEGLGYDIDDLEKGEFALFKSLVEDYSDSIGGLVVGVDDRAAVGFLDEPATIGGVPRNEGDPFDAAIYLASTTGDVDVSSPVSIISGEIPEGAMVIDAFDTVTFDGGTLPGDGDTFFQDSLAGDGIMSYVGDRLEVASRITEWLFQAFDNGRLPYVYGGGPFPPGYDYVLRGAGLGNPGITDGRAWVLEDPIPPAPLNWEAGEASEEVAFGPGGCPPLMAWLAGELGIPEETIRVYLADAFLYSTAIQPCDACARLLEAATVLEDLEGTRIAALAQVVNEFVAPDVPITPEQMASIASAVLSPEAGTTYAAAGQWLDALAEYVGILNAEMGFSVPESVAFVGKYLAPVAELDNASLTAYVEARVAALGG